MLHVCEVSPMGQAKHDAAAQKLSDVQKLRSNLMGSPALSTKNHFSKQKHKSYSLSSIRFVSSLSRTLTMRSRILASKPKPRQEIFFIEAGDEPSWEEEIVGS